MCCIGDSFDWCASIFRSTRCRAHRVDGQALLDLAQGNEVSLVGDGGGAGGAYSV